MIRYWGDVNPGSYHYVTPVRFHDTLKDKAEWMFFAVDRKSKLEKLYHISLISDERVRVSL